MKNTIDTSSNLGEHEILSPPLTKNIDHKIQARMKTNELSEIYMDKNEKSSVQDDVAGNMKNDDRMLYEKAWNEIKKGNYDVGIWAKALTDSEEDEKRTERLLLLNTDLKG